MIEVKMKFLAMTVAIWSIATVALANERIVVRATKGEMDELGIASQEVMPGWRVFIASDTTVIGRLKEKGFYAEPDYIMKITETEYDSLFPLQWGLTGNNNMWQGDFREAWKITRGNPGIKIGVIDTGSPLKDGKWTHPDLDSTRFLVVPPKNFINNDLGYQPDNLDQTITDFNGHATHIAGIIAASHNGRGVEGIDTSATLVFYKAFTWDGWGYYSWIANAIYRAVHDGCKILNMSFEGWAYSRLLEEAMGYAHSSGVISIVASGNGGIEQITFPAFFSRFSTKAGYREGLSSIISVGAVDDWGKIASYSNRGWFVDIYAPGGRGNFPINNKGNILSTFPTYEVTLNDTTMGWPYQTEYGYLAGTSMATPFVVGTVSLMLSVNPKLTGGEIRDILVSSADSIKTTEGMVKILNPGEAISRALGVTPVAQRKEREEIPTKRFYLFQNFPNPFNPETTISYVLPKASQVTLKIYNLLGEEVATLLNNEEKPAGSHTIHWQPENLAAGTYIYRLKVGDFVETRKMVFMK